MTKYLYHPYTRFVIMLLVAALILFDCEPDDVPGSGRW